MHASLTTSSFNPSCLPCATLVCKSVHDIHKPHRVFVRFVLFCFVLSLRNNQSILVCLCVKVFIHRYTPGSKEAKERAKELKRKGEKKSALLAVAK